jgi:hypothetical protein
LEETDAKEKKMELEAPSNAIVIVEARNFGFLLRAAN